MPNKNEKARSRWYGLFVRAKDLSMDGGPDVSTRITDSYRSQQPSTVPCDDTAVVDDEAVQVDDCVPTSNDADVAQDGPATVLNERVVDREGNDRFQQATMGNGSSSKSLESHPMNCQALYPLSLENGQL